MATITVMRDRAEDRFRDTANAIVSPTEWLNYFNDAFMEVQQASPWWPWKENQYAEVTVAAGARGVGIGTDMWHVDSVFNKTDNYPMAPIHGRSTHLGAFSPEGADPEETGLPTHYRIRNDAILVYPVPAAATVLRLESRSPVAALTVNDEPPWSEHFHDILIDGALYRAYLDDENHAQANMHQSQFNAKLEYMKNDLLGPRDESYPALVDRW